MGQELKVGTVLIFNILWSNWNPCKPCFHLKLWWTIRKYSSFYGRSSRFKISQRIFGSCTQEMKAFGWGRLEVKMWLFFSTHATSWEIQWIISWTVCSATLWSPLKLVGINFAKLLTKPLLLMKFSNSTDSFSKKSLIQLWTHLVERL